jgi:hypothetical protein
LCSGCRVNQEQFKYRVRISLARRRIESVGGQGDCFFKFTPTLHVCVLRAGIKRGENRLRRKEKYQTETK